MQDHLTYKDYIGTVSYSAESDVFYGKIQGINDTVTFEGKSTTELKNAFKESIDDYLETCESLGKNPDKTYKGVFNVRVNKDLHKRAALAASRKQISLNDFVKKAIAFALNHESDLDKEAII